MRDKKYETCIMNNFPMGYAYCRNGEEYLRKLVAIMENTSDYIAMCDLEGVNTIYHNSPLFRFLGKSGDESDFLTMDEVHPPEYALFIKTVAIPEALRNGFWKGETCLVDQNGTRFPVEQSIFPVKDCDGNVFAVAAMMRDISEKKYLEEGKKQAEKDLKESEEKYRLIAENTADTIVILDLNLKNVYISPSVQKLRGYTAEEAMGQSLQEVLVPDSLLRVYHLYAEEKVVEASGKGDPGRSHLLELQTYCKDGSVTWIETRLSLLRDERLKPTGILVVARDMSIRKQNERKIFEQKAQFQALFTNTNDAMAFFDIEEKITEINVQFAIMFGYELQEVKGRNINEVIDPLKKVIEYGSPKILRGEPIELETIRYDRKGRAIHMLIKGGPVYIGGIITGGYAIYSNISERKRYEEELKYLSLHDKLTGLYNRAFFEEELIRFNLSRDYPMTIISADVDGLKIINDTLGHDKGDELLRATAEILKRSLRRSDICARIGGDEFTVLLPKTDEKTGESLLKRIRTNIEKYNLQNPKSPISISLGMATAEKNNMTLGDIYKKADDSMYHSKLHKSSSMKSKIIDTLMKALGERDYITEGHGKRLTRLCEKVGEGKDLNSAQIDNIKLLAQVHDLGKVGIPDNILFKKGKLTEEEWEIMRQHPEKGYRIASSSPDLFGIADLILKHHEKWDGTGYPLGLKGNDIPVECRILAIVDAFDAMTNDRPYSKAKTRKEAIDELLRCSGTQFDPELISIFLKVLPF